MDEGNSEEKVPLQNMSTCDDQLFSSSADQTTQVNGDGHKCFFFTKRCMISILALLGFCNVYALRVNLSVAIVAMVAKKRIQGAEGKIIEVSFVKLKAKLFWFVNIATLLISERFWQFCFFTKRSTLLLEKSRKIKFLHLFFIEQSAKFLPFLLIRVDRVKS